MRGMEGAVEEFERHVHRFSADACRKHALKFSPENFRDAIQTLVEREWAAFTAQREDKGVLIEDAPERVARLA